MVESLCRLLIYIVEFWYSASHCVHCKPWHMVPCIIVLHPRCFDWQKMIYIIQSWVSIFLLKKWQIFDYGTARTPKQLRVVARSLLNATIRNACSGAGPRNTFKQKHIIIYYRITACCPPHKRRWARGQNLKNGGQNSSFNSVEYICSYCHIAAMVRSLRIQKGSLSEPFLLKGLLPPPPSAPLLSVLVNAKPIGGRV